MKQITKQFNRKSAFTIVELLTVMSIIVILIGLLVPALNRVKRYARRVKQKAQFHSIDVAMELFNTEFDGHPNSEEKDEATPPQSYCGAMKLCEAMMGQDLLGFHPASRLRADCTDGASPPVPLYDNPSGSLATPPNPIPSDNLKARRGPYIQLENANAYRLWNIYGKGQTNPFPEDLFVLCDVYSRVANKDPTGGESKIGMPILYYKANPSGTENPHKDKKGDIVPPGGIDKVENIYDYKDNDELVKLGIPWNAAAGVAHLMASGNQPTFYPSLLSHPKYFYFNINNSKIEINEGRPYRSDSYILLSAGYDGEYGTEDDVFNFGD